MSKVMEKSPSSFRTYICLAWLVFIGGLSFYLWGVSVKPGPWIGSWSVAFFDALFSLPSVLVKHPGTLWGAVVVGCASVCGRSLLSRLMREVPPWSLSFAGGMAVLSTLLVVLGSLGLFRPLPIAAITAAAGLAGLVDLIFILPKRNFHDRRQALRPLEYVLVVLSGLIVLVGLMNPTWFYDALNYHLALPRQYLISGSTDPVSWHPYSFFPSSAEMISGAGLLGGTLSAQLISGGAWLFTILALRDIAVRYVSARSGPAVIAAALATITVTNSAVLPGIDHFVLLFAVGGLFFLCGMFEKLDMDKSGLVLWITGWGIMAGGAATIKYTAWRDVLLLQTIMLTAIAFRHGRLRQTLPGLAAAALVLLPWPLRNMAVSGNPLMPMTVDGIWQGMSETAWQTFQQDAHAVNLSLSKIPDILAAPWTMVFDRWHDLVKEWGAAHFVGPLVWMGVPLFFVFGKKDRKFLLIMVYGIVALYLSVGSFKMIRFAYPAIGALLIIAGAGVHEFMAGSKKRRTARAAAAFIFAAVFVLCASVLFKTTANLTGGYAYPRLDGDKLNYVERLLRVTNAPPNALPLQVKANRQLPPDSRILLAGETRFFYLQKETVAPYFLVPHPFFELIKKTSFAHTAQRLKVFGFTHLMICVPEIERLGPRYEKTGYPLPETSRVIGFINSGHCEIILEDRERGSVLCRLRSADESALSTGPLE